MPFGAGLRSGLFMLGSRVT